MLFVVVNFPHQVQLICYLCLPDFVTARSCHFLVWPGHQGNIFLLPIGFSFAFAVAQKQFVKPHWSLAIPVSIVRIASCWAYNIMPFRRFQCSWAPLSFSLFPYSTMPTVSSSCRKYTFKPNILALLPSWISPSQNYDYHIMITSFQVPITFLSPTCWSG